MGKPLLVEREEKEKGKVADGKGGRSHYRKSFSSFLRNLQRLIYPSLATAMMEDSRRECLDKLLSQNFDKVSSVCVVTISKYVVNILSNPDEPKYRTINMQNKAFQEKILVCNGSMELMQSFGFRNDNAADSLHSSASAQFMVFDSSSSAHRLCMYPNSSFLLSNI